MSKSEQDPDPELDTEQDTESGSVSRPRRKISTRLAAAVRWLHIYISMIGLAATLFFSVTGITLNHAGWFFADAQDEQTIKGTLNADLLSELRDPDSKSAQLNVAEFMRSNHHLGGAVKEFSVDEFQSVVAFAGPGYSADIFVDNENGEYEITEIKQGFVAIINDLHKGRDTGPAWSWVIDLSAIVLCLISASGLLLLFWLRRRRLKGLLTMAVGTFLLFAVYWWAVP